MSKRTLSFDAVSVLQIVVALFLFTLGIIGIADWSSEASQFGRGLTRLVGGSNNPVNIAVAVVELAAGVVVFGALFITLRSRLVYWLTIIIAALWVLEIVVGFLAHGIFQPDFIVWLNRLSADLIILAGLWLINRKYA